MLRTKTFAVATCSLAMLFISLTAKSQANDPGSWNVINGEYDLNKKWNLWGEVQLRSQKLTDQFYYHELKTGVNFKPDKNVAILLGTGQYVTYSNGGNFKSPVLTHEFRLWEQLTLINNITDLRLNIVIE